MPIKRITFSMPEELARNAKKAAGKQTLSAWLTQLVQERIGTGELDRLWAEFYADVAPSRADERRARATLERLTERTTPVRAKRRRAA